MMKRLRKTILGISAAVLCAALLPTSAWAHSRRPAANVGSLSTGIRTILDLLPTSIPPSPSVKLETYPIQMNIGDTSVLEYTIEHASDSRSTVTSSDSSVVRVNGDGTLTAVSEGTATITVSGSGAEASFDVTVRAVPVSSITISQLPERLQLGQTAQASATVLPQNATDPTVEWKSSDPAIAQVSQEGTVTTVRPGEVTITCRAASGVEAKVSLTVYEVLPEEIRTDVDQLRLLIGTSQAVTIEILPEYANNKNYTVTMEDEEIAAWLEGNTVEARKDGSTELVIETENQVTKRIPVSVYHIPVRTVTIDDSAQEYVYPMFMEHAVDQDSALRLSVRLLPEDATYPEVEWESSNPEVISVSGGTMEIRGTGDVVLTAVSHDGTKDSIRLKVVSRGKVNGAVGFASVAVMGILFLLVLIAGKRLQAAKKEMNHGSSDS